MKEIPIILLIAFVLGFIISLWVWYSIEKTADGDDKDNFDYFEYFEDDDIVDDFINIEYDDDTEFIKYWYS